MIEGVRIVPRNRISDVRGVIQHGIRNEELVHNFGEVYFKRLFKGIINGWHVHETLTLNYLCVSGIARLVLCDLRPNSKTYKQINEIIFGQDNYVLVHIPPGIANATETLSYPESIICNIASEPHNPQLRYRRIDPNSNEIEFDWSKKNF